MLQFSAMKAANFSLSAPPGDVATPGAARRRHGTPGINDSHDRLTPAQRRLMVGIIVTVHAAAIWALLQVQEVRDAVAQVAPMLVSIVAPPAPPRVETPPPPPVVEKRITPLLPPLIAAAPSPAPAPFNVPAPLAPEPEPPPVAVVAAPPPVIAVPAPAPPAPPRTLPASAVQYLEPLVPDYPRLSKRLGESGRVVVRVYIDEAGLARNTQVNRSSGHPRLDDAALAAVQKARFKPYTENGQAIAGWAFIPIDFELER